MRLKEIIFSEESKRGLAFYYKLLKWLDSPKRRKINNPEKLVDNAGICKGQVVLEIGCGGGFFTEEISKRVGSEGKVYATDIHPVAIKETKKKALALGLTNVEVELQDAMNTSFNDNSFDMIILYGVIPAPVISLSKLSKEMYRILKPNGICAIWTGVPFWRPRAIIQSARFEEIKRLYPIFRLQKKINESR